MVPMKISIISALETLTEESTVSLVFKVTYKQHLTFGFRLCRCLRPENAQNTVHRLQKTSQTTHKCKQIGPPENKFSSAQNRLLPS